MENNHLLEDTSWKRVDLEHPGCYILIKQICEAHPEKLTGFFQALLNKVEWQQKPIRMWSQLFLEPRKTAWYGDEGCNYVYSRIARRAIPWTNELAEIKELVEKESHTTFNSCLCNRYDDGNMYMNWHADDEDTLGEKSIIASLSLGASRKFYLRAKKGSGAKEEKKSVILQNGTLMLMFGDVQKYYEHCVPKCKTDETRLNLTFRTIIKSVPCNEASLDAMARDVALAKEYQQMSASRVRVKDLYGNGNFEEGTRFDHRAELWTKAVHRKPIGGVCGNGKNGAESVLMSGGYGEDLDLGKIVIYTGCGGRRRNGTPFEHQSMGNHYNKALRTNYEKNIPLRLIRSSQLNSGFAPKSGWTYDGVYSVKFYWREKGPDGNLRYRFLMVSDGNHLKTQTNCRITEFLLQTKHGIRDLLSDCTKPSGVESIVTDVHRLALDSNPTLTPVKQETRQIIDTSDEDNPLLIIETNQAPNSTVNTLNCLEAIFSETSNSSEVNMTLTNEAAARPSDAMTTPLSTCEGSSSPKKEEDSFVNMDVDLNSSGDLPPLQVVNEPGPIVVNNIGEPSEEENLFLIPEDDPHYYLEENDAEGNTTVIVKIHVSYPSHKFETRRKLLQKPTTTKLEACSLPVTPIKPEPFASNRVLTQEMEIENSNSLDSIDSNVNTNTDNNSTSESDGPHLPRPNFLPYKKRFGYRQQSTNKPKEEDAQLLLGLDSVSFNRKSTSFYGNGNVTKQADTTQLPPIIVDTSNVKVEEHTSISSLLATDESLPDDSVSKPVPALTTNTNANSAMDIDLEPTTEDMVEKLVTITIAVDNKTKIGTTKVETRWFQGGAEVDFPHSCSSAEIATLRSSSSNSLTVQAPIKMSASLPATPLLPRVNGPGRRRKREEEDTDGSYEPNSKRVKRSLRSNGVLDDKENVVNFNESVATEMNIADMLGTNGMPSRRTKAGIKRLSWCDAVSPCMYCTEYITGNLILKQACKFRPKGLKKPKARAQKKLVA